MAEVLSALCLSHSPYLAGIGSLEAEAMSTENLLELEFPKMRYDITMPLLEGRVEIEGVKFKPVKTPVMVSNEDSPLKEGNFHLWELNLSFFLPVIEAGWHLVGLPVFPKRKPVYEYIFCNVNSGIESPRDLEGKNIGAGSYVSTVSTWARGLLRNRHGVDIHKMRWIVQNKGRFPNYDQETKIEVVGREKSPVDRLMEGEVDAIIMDISDANLFDTLENSPKIKRLFPNYVEEDEKLYRETGIYTPMHLIVMSKKLDRQYPELAGKIYAAFEQAKKTAYEDILNDRAGFSVVYLREKMKEQIDRWGDPYKYGIKANKQMIDTLIKDNYEQGGIRSEPSYNEIFAGSTLQT